MTPERIKQLRAMEQAATPGPWTQCSAPDTNNRAGIGDNFFEFIARTDIVSIHSTDRCEANAAFIAESRTAIPELLDEVERLQSEDAEWSKLCNQQNDLLEQKYAIKDPQLCGWCWRAAGDGDAAKESLPKYTIADVREHTLTCANNPLVAERDALATRLAEATNLDSRDAEIIAARSELHKLRAALAEACDIADRHIFAPTMATAAQPHPETAQPLNAGESFKLIPGTGNACAAAPPVLGQVFTINVDTGAPYREKARIAELRAKGRSAK